jgi:hypothetical protein
MDDSKHQQDEIIMNCTTLPSVDEKTPHEIALARCNCLIERYYDWKKKNHEKSDWAQRTALIFTAITPVLLLIHSDYVKLVAATTSAVAAIATGLLAISGWRENYIRYGYTWHALQTEKYRYLTHATTEYSECDEENATRNFANRIEQLVMAEVTDWRTEMQRLEKSNRPNASS